MISVSELKLLGLRVEMRCAPEVHEIGFECKIDVTKIGPDFRDDLKLWIVKLFDAD